MPKKSATGSVVRRSAANVTPASPDDLERLRAAMESRIDTSEIPERLGAFHRLRRDETGKLPVRKSVIREAIAREMGRLKITPYRLWKDAREHCPTLSQAAVYEFIKGQRQLELPYAEALMAALHLRVARTRALRPRHPTAQPKPAARTREK